MGQNNERDKKADKERLFLEGNCLASSRYGETKGNGRI